MYVLPNTRDTNTSDKMEEIKTTDILLITLLNFHFLDIWKKISPKDLKNYSPWRATKNQPMSPALKTPVISNKSVAES
jgi:hypothetical protein